MALYKLNKIARNDRTYLRNLKKEDLIDIIEFKDAIPIGIDKALSFNNPIYFKLRKEFLNNNPKIYKLQEAEYVEAYELEEYDSLTYSNKEVDDMVNFANRFTILKPIIHVVYAEL